MNRILILGCDGYIGEYLVEKLSKSNFSIIGFDLKNTKSSSNLLEKFYQGDIKNIDELEQCVVEANPEVIIDLAANAVVTNESDISNYKENFCTPENILEILQKNSSLALKRIIFTSSQYVIGPEYSGGDKLGYAPHTTYGISKVILEQRIMQLETQFSNFDIDYFIVRPTNVWGGRHPKYSTTFEALLKRYLVILPSKTVTKSYCHISTLSKLYEKIVRYERENLNLNERIIYGTDVPMSQVDWVKLQVSGLRSHGVGAGFFKSPIWTLYFLSFLITNLTSLLRLTNPLPRSRVDSMSYDYYVNLDAPAGLSHNQSYQDLINEVDKDLIARISKS